MALQRVRIVAISDTHSQTPHLPPGDILIHAGDLCQQGTPKEMRKVIKWLEALDFRLKIVVAGNHDACLDRNAHSHAVDKEESEANKVRELLRRSPTIQYLQHEAKLLRLRNEDGTEVKIKVFASPHTPGKRSRAFGYAPEEAVGIWDKIPLDTDIVVAHTPAKYHLDESPVFGSIGCPHLREALWRVRPKLFVCGHIHEGRGAEAVTWDIETPNVKYKEATVSQISDETGNSKKQFRIDLTSNSRMSLINDGSRGTLVPYSARSKRRGVEVGPHGMSSSMTPPSRGQGGQSANPDQEAMLDREGRKETCFVNASYVPGKSLSKSHRADRQFNKPIVIDLDFPIDGGVDEWYANALIASTDEICIGNDLSRSRAVGTAPGS